MTLRTLHVGLLAGLATISGAAPLAAQSWQIPICPSYALTQQVQQSQPGSPLPDGCRMVGVRQVNTPYGTACAVDISEGSQGLLADIMDATVTTRWWTACSNLTPPP
jgi:hypothetical protein